MIAFSKPVPPPGRWTDSRPELKTYFNIYYGFIYDKIYLMWIGYKYTWVEDEI